MRDLLSGRYRSPQGAIQVPPSYFGQLQSGPYLEGEGRDRKLVLTMIDADRCVRIEKAYRNSLGPTPSPSRVESVSCSDGIEYRRNAEIPEPVGFGPLGVNGSRLLTALDGVTWEARRDCFLNGSDEERVEFGQTLRLQLMEQRREIDIYSQARAFSSRLTSVIPEWRVAPVQILKLREQSEGAVTRVLIWGDRFRFATDDENRMSIATVDPDSMNAPESATLMLFGGDRYCINDRCVPTRSVEFTRHVRFHYMVLEMSAHEPNRLQIKLAEVDPDRPVIELRYQRRVEP